MSVMTEQKLPTALTQRFLSNIRDVIQNFKKMLKPWEGEEKFPFSFNMRQWWPPQQKGGVTKLVFPCQKVSFSCHREAQRHITFVS